MFDLINQKQLFIVFCHILPDFAMRTCTDLYLVLHPEVIPTNWESGSHHQLKQPSTPQQHNYRNHHYHSNRTYPAVEPEQACVQMSQTTGKQNHTQLQRLKTSPKGHTT